MPAKSTKGKMTLVRQTCELIPSHLVPKVARDYEIDARTFSPWSHTTAHIYGQLTHAVSLNDICDGLELNSSELRAIRGATPPKRNTFSHANRTRDPRMAEELYWRMIEYLPTVAPSFEARSTNMLERVNQEIKRRTFVIRIFPNEASCLRLVRALAVEIHEDWIEQHRYLNMELLREHRKLRLAKAT